jgi:hypothetical protein
MRKLCFFTIAILICATRISAQTAVGAETRIESLTTGQLCDMRGSEEALAELERRELFSKRELRAIKKQIARRGISVEALVCAMGLPDRITHGSPRAPERLDRYYYLREDELDLEVIVRHEEDRSILLFVAHLAELPD